MRGIFVAVSVALALLGSCYATREVVSFDFAWRYSPATDPRYERCEIEENVK